MTLLQIDDIGVVAFDYHHHQEGQTPANRRQGGKDYALDHILDTRRVAASLGLLLIRLVFEINHRRWLIDVVQLSLAVVYFVSRHRRNGYHSPEAPYCPFPTDDY